MEQAISVGLAAPHPQLGHLVQVQPVLPYFLRSRLHDKPALAAAASQAHYQLYTSLGGTLDNMLTSRDNPQERAAPGRPSPRAEYANLTTALAYGLTHQPARSSRSSPRSMNTWTRPSSTTPAASSSTTR